MERRGRLKLFVSLKRPEGVISVFVVISPYRHPFLAGKQFFSREMKRNFRLPCLPVPERSQRSNARRVSRSRKFCFTFHTLSKNVRFLRWLCVQNAETVLRKLVLSARNYFVGPFYASCWHELGISKHLKTLKALKNRTGRGFLPLTPVKPYPAYYVTGINTVENEMSKRVSLLRFHRAQRSHIWLYCCLNSSRKSILLIQNNKHDWTKRHAI